MKIVQTFWSGTFQNQSPLEIRAGWLSPEYHWMSWSLSCLLLTRLYDQVELYTDETGKQVLIDILKLPYTDVHVIFDDSFKIHPQLFSVAKIRTYSLQKEPFVHVDGDVFLWKGFPQPLLDSELIASNLEKDLFFNKEILDEVEKNFKVIPAHLKGVNIHKNIFSSNAGIIGGSNISFIQKYCKEAIDFIESNKTNLDLVKTGSLNFLVEQISLYYLSTEENVPITYFMPTPVEHPLYQDYLRFADVPNVEMIHLVGGCKKLPHILDHLANRLKIEFPNFYFNILRLCKDKNIVLNTRFYNYIRINEDTDIQDPYTTLGEVDNRITELSKSDFLKSYKRTIDATEYYYSRPINTHYELIKLVYEENAPNQLKEIYSLDKQCRELFETLINEIIPDDGYYDEFNRYRQSSNFHFTRNWMDREVIYTEGLKILDLKWNWKLIVEEPHLKTFDKILKKEESSHCVTLNYNVKRLEIHETYLDGIDEIILKSIKEEKQIRQIVLKVSEHFEEHITVENLQYQRLIYDTIKRLAFSNIIIIK
ncbi:DUF6734 family protein [Maribacter sp. 4G9]|uniref:DUF6734 family protein n=1 Tax=Maribacter sp. 4G9 TaxID=1889777 RepID=UPI000F4FE5C9|nr:DUF6734 family protein [Maribacter sp. 4G9]